MVFEIDMFIKNARELLQLTSILQQFVPLYSLRTV